MNNLWAEYTPLFANGVWVTLQLTFISSFIGLAFALPLAFAALSRNPLFSAPVSAFSYFFRGTPLLVQIYLLYYGLGQFSAELRQITWLWNIVKQPYWCAIIAFSLNTCAYTIEIFKGSFRNTAKGEIEAAIAMGMSQWQIFYRIIFPSGFRRALPAYSNEVIFMLHGTAQVFVIALVNLDILGVARKMQRATFYDFTPYLIAACLYLLITFLLVFIFKKCEKRWLSYLQTAH
ncbi:ABC transporter permease [Wohlfahrtiimonas chitiniclastica]|uniref:ABC transporter permease n=1 Tax=Wohlfahrtiimonas chitiniclastica TaxID=400946 RepID=UPI001BCD1665|nr:ABC transporter permease subunit [Wohlfahrtiimonas chitiniclastica]MBS7837464.1 ABC transporter permease subunit [Wohlfahrtiimonas chitiniclastica]